MKDIRKNSLLDILIIIVATLVLSLFFGFVIYVVFVYIILPLAVELIPALDKYLTKIGRENDVSEIYRTIFSGCALLAIFPAICAANAEVKARRKSFIRNTDGMIRKKDGFFYHVKNHLWYDAVAIIGIAAAGLALSLADFGFIAFPFDIIYKYLGGPLGVLISVVITIVGQMFGILFAQNCWRADNFFGD